MLSNRQIIILKLVLDEYIKTGRSISSKFLVEKFKINSSTATIRIELNELEKYGYLTKQYKASGRKPTKKGYDYYFNNIKVSNDEISKLEDKMFNVFENRNDSIEQIFNKSLDIINESTNTLSFIKENDRSKLEDLKIYELSNKKFLVIVVTNQGNVYKSEVEIGNISFNDLLILIGIFAERLKGVSVIELKDEALILNKLILDRILILEKDYRSFVNTIFSKLIKERENLKGINTLINSNTIDINNISKLIRAIEDKSIWNLLKKSKKSVVGSDLEVILELEDFNNVSIISKTFELPNDVSKSLTLIGSKFQNYKTLINLLDILDDKLKK